MKIYKLIALFIIMFIMFMMPMCNSFAEDNISEIEIGYSSPLIYDNTLYSNKYITDKNSEITYIYHLLNSFEKGEKCNRMPTDTAYLSFRVKFSSGNSERYDICSGVVQIFYSDSKDGYMTSVGEY